VDKLKFKLDAIKSSNIVPASLKKMETELKNITKECDNAQKEYDSFTEKFSSAEMELNFAKSSGDTARIGEAQNILSNLENESLIAGDKLSDLQNKASKLETSIKQIKMNPETSQEATEISKSLGVMESKLQTSKDKANNLKNELNKTLNQKGNVINTLDSINNKVDSLGGKLKASLLDKISALNKNVERFGKRITGLIASALIFNILSNGLRNLASGFGFLLKSNGQFSSSLNQIKANLITAFAPIYNYVLPAINALMSALSRITGTIASFVSGLFGKTVDQSKKSASALYNQAKAYDKAGKSAKKAEGNLASFDKLEVIGDKGDSSGGGQDDIDFSGPVQQSGELLDFLNKIKESLAGINFEPLKNSLYNLWDSLGFLGNGIVDLAKDFYNNFLLPLSTYVIENTLPNFFNATADAIKQINFEKISSAFNELYEALLPFTKSIFDGLEWFYENILIPLGLWVMNDVVPAFLGILSGALNVLNKAINDIKPIFEWLWDNILSPIAEWTGGVIVDVLNGIGDALNWISNNELAMTILESLAIAIGLVAGAIAIYNGVMAICNIVTGIFSGIMAVLTSPITLVILAITALVAIIILCVKHWDEIKEAAVKCWEWIKEAWNKAGEWFNNTIIKPITDFFSNMWNGLKDGAKNAWEGIKSAFSKVTDWFKNVFSKAWQAVKNVFSTGGKIFDGIKEGIANVFKTVVNGIIGGINKVIAVPFNTINGLLNKIRSVSVAGIEPFKGFIKKNPLSVPQIPMLAQGAVIPPNAKFLAMLGDQRNGRNLEAPEKLIRQIVREESGNNNREFILNLKAILECDKKQFGEISFEGIRMKEQQNGKKYFLN